MNTILEVYLKIILGKNALEEIFNSAKKILDWKTRCYVIRKMKKTLKIYKNNRNGTEKSKHIILEVRALRNMNVKPNNSSLSKVSMATR